MMICQAPVESSQDVETREKEMKEAAREILKYCDVTDEAKVEDIIDKMTKYLERKFYYMQNDKSNTTLSFQITHRKTQRIRWSN